MSTIQFRARRPADSTNDTDLQDVNPLRESFNRFASGSTLTFIDSDGTKADAYPYGTRVAVQYSTDGGSSYATRLEGFVVDTTRTTRSGVPLVETDLVAYDHLLRRHKVTKSYSSSSISTILKDLVETFTGVTWNASNVTVINDATISPTFKGLRVDECIARLASESGGEEYGVTDALEFTFQPQDATRAPAIGDTDVVGYDLPEQGKRAINRFELFYGTNGDNSVVVEDRESQQDLKDKLGATRTIEVSDSDTITEITTEDRAETVARQRLNEHSVIQTGTVTVPLGRFDVSAGDVFELTIGDAGIDAVDFRVAQIEYRWSTMETVLTVAENAASNMEDLLVGLSDSVSNVRARDADPGATTTQFLDFQSGVELTTTASVITKQPPEDAFVLGQSQLGMGTDDTLGGGVASSSAKSTTSAKAGRALLNLLRDHWQDGAGAFVDLSHVGVGTDAAAATRADDGLQAAVDRVAVRSVTSAGGEAFEVVATVPAGGVAGDADALQELSVFDAASGGTGYLRVTHDAADLDATTRLSVHAVVELASDPDGQGVVTTTGQRRVRDLVVGGAGHEPTERAYGTGGRLALEGDGDGDFVGTGLTYDSSQSSGLTVALWVRPDWSVTQDFGRVASADANEYWSLQRAGANDALQWVGVESDGTQIAANIPVGDGELVHATVVVDLDDGELRTYKDGSETDSAAFATAAWGTGDVSRNVTILAGTEDADPTSGQDNEAAGVVDDPRVYHRVLSDAEITTLADGGNPDTTALAGHWRLDEGSGTTAADSSHQNNDGTINGDPSWVDGFVGPFATESSLGTLLHADAIDATADRSTGVTDVVERITAADADTTGVAELGERNAAGELLTRVTFEEYPDDAVVESNHRFFARNA